MGIDYMDTSERSQEPHQHPRRGTDATLSVGANDSRKSEKPLETKDEFILQQRTDAPAWETDPRGYYTTFYSQFANIIMISTFTGGVQAAVLSFMNDLLSGESLKVELFHQHPDNPGRTVYSAYSLGLMLGLLAVALNLTVAAIAAVNAALACHFSLHIPASKPSMEARIVFCMFIQFIASGVAGISLVLLCLKFDLAFAIVAAILFFSGIVISAYHLVSLFGPKWFTKLKGQPLHSISLILSTLAFIFDLVSPSHSSWFTISTYGVTVTYHMMAVLHHRSSHGDRPRRLATFTVMVIAALWVGCVTVTAIFRHSRYVGSNPMHENMVRWTIEALAGIEAVVLFAIGIRYWFILVKWKRAHPESAK